MKHWTLIKLPKWLGHWRVSIQITRGSSRFKDGYWSYGTLPSQISCATNSVAMASGLYSSTSQFTVPQSSLNQLPAQGVSCSKLSDLNAELGMAQSPWPPKAG